MVVVTRLPRALALAGALLLALRAGAEVTFETLPDLPGGTDFTAAYGVSADGSVIVGASRSALGREAVRWVDGVAQALGDLPGGFHQSEATAVSADGSVVVGTGRTADADEAFRWEDGTMLALGGVPNAYPVSWARAVSPDGSIVVGRSVWWGGSHWGFVWRNGVAEPIWDQWTEDFWCETGQGVTDHGTIAGWGKWFGDPDRVAYAINGTALRALGVPPDASDPFYQANGLSPSGNVIVGSSSSDGTDSEAAMWKHGRVFLLGDLPGGHYSSWANAVSADGSLVVGRGTDASGIVAMMWDAHRGIHSLTERLQTEHGIDLGGWVLSNATAVSWDGRTVVGWAWTPEMEARAFVVRFPSECDDGVDNDGDGLIDVSADPGCTSADDATELSGDLACDDGLDGDGDGMVDLSDPGCRNGTWPTEAPACSNGVDDDQDGAIDWPADVACAGPSGLTETAGNRCGIGFELVVPLLFLRRLRR